ncbi:lipocalin family protein [Adhaeribacter swui]|uniref:Lipocalin family protein n=1 Tax=Adhaeribacter swui TaxID=2086471 RepID=A0A7G7G4R0_9BACT|nr:lipocalin family protein [Adhaeribacter swui]QNF32144.1 lipocalin family protein [Adhaeribacter swui]
MITRQTIFMIFFFLAVACTQAQSQGIDRRLLIGKWQLVETTVGENGYPSGNNARSILTFQENGRWKTEDKIATFRGSGTWKLQDSILIRVPDLHLTNYTGTREVHRKITLLTPQKMVFELTNHPEGGQEGYPKYIFHLTKIK